MGEEKQKTYQEWQDLVSGLGDKTFEELSYRVLTKLGFEEVKPRGGSADGGRDLEGKRTHLEPDNKTKIIENYWFECKCYSSTIPWKEISDKLHSANIDKIDKFVILSNRGLSPDAQDKVKKFMGESRVKVIEWCGFPFLDLLFQQSELCETYFSGIPVPNNPPEKNKPNHILKAVFNLSEGFGIELQTEVPSNVKVTDENIKEIIFGAIRKINAKNIDLDNETKARLFYNIAMIFSQFGFNLDAMTFVENSLKIKESIQGLINKAVIQERLHDLAEARKTYESILKKEKYNLIVLNNLAKNLSDQFLLEDALVIINQALEINPDFLPAINNKSHILKSLKKYEEALELVNSKIDDNSSTPLQKTKVDILIEALDLKEAFRINEQLLNLDPSDVDLVNNKGVIYEHNAQYQLPEKYYELAFKTFAEARLKRKDYLLALSNQVVCFLNVGNLEEAESLTNSGLSIMSDNPYLLHNKSKIELQKGNSKSALNYVEKAVKISSQEKFLVTKAQILMILRKHDKVEKLCMRLLQIDEKNTDAMNFLGQSLRVRHRMFEAKKWFKKARETRKKYISLLE